ncbi:MAG TPA: ferritin family protein [Polyangiaceae bacterium]
MTDKTRSIDFANISLRDALDLAVLVEEEAKDRYEEFADQMDKHHNPEAAKFFRYMLAIEAKHESRLAERRKGLFGDEPRAVKREMIFDIEAPEYDEVRANMTVRQALETSLRAETKAFEFFEAAAGRVQMQAVKDIFTELREEERGHQALVQKEIGKLPPEGPASGEDDEIVAL